MKVTFIAAALLTISTAAFAQNSTGSPSTVDTRTINGGTPLPQASTPATGNSALSGNNANSAGGSNAAVSNSGIATSGSGGGGGGGSGGGSGGGN
jgi:hypothetical protein